MKTIAFTSAILLAGTIFSGNTIAQHYYQCGDKLCSSITNVRPVVAHDSRNAERYGFRYPYVDPNRKPDRIFYLDDEKLGKNAIRVEQYFMNGYGGYMYGGGYPGMYGGNMGYGYPGFGYGMGGYGMGGYGYGGYGMGGYPYGYRGGMYRMW